MLGLSLGVGLAFSAFWLACVQADTARALPVLRRLVGVDEKGALAKPSIFTSGYRSMMDSLAPALPLSFIAAVVVVFLAKPMSGEHLSRCFSKR